MKELNWKTLTSIQAGIYVCLPAILGGHILFVNYGLKGAILSLIIGSIILWAISLMYARMAYNEKKVLVELAHQYFGRWGAQICGLAFTISLMGWFAIQLDLMSKGVAGIIPNASNTLINMTLATIITLNVARGIGSIGKVANYSFVFLAFVMISILLKSYNAEQYILNSSWDMHGIPLVLVLSIAGVVDTPTYFANSKSLADANIAITIVYLAMLPLMALVGIFLAMYSNETDFILALQSLGGSYWSFVMVVFVLVGGWTTNNGNLYSSSVAMKYILPRVKFSNRTLMLGVLGFSLSLLNNLSNIEVFLSSISIIVGVLGAGLLSTFVWSKYGVVKKYEKELYLGIMILSTSIGILSELNIIHVTGFGFLDGFIICFVLSSLYEGGVMWKLLNTI